MFAHIKRHPLPIRAHFTYSLVLTYAFPQALLKPLLPPGLTLDTHGDFGFLAIALVQTRALRPAGFPRFLGRDFFLSGYRIFARRIKPSGQVLRGLRILRSDTDSRAMAFVGNLLTHYKYRLCRVEAQRTAERLSLSIHTPNGEADLALIADLTHEPAAPPAGSPFPDWQTARQFAGPLPFTFEYEAASHSLVSVQGVRENWTPRPVAVTVASASFFKQAPFSQAEPLLANAFYIENISYRWRRGEIEKLPPEVR